MTVGIVVSVFTLFEIKEQSRINAEQISILKNNSDIANRITIFSEFYPNYSISDAEFISDGTKVGVKFNFANQSDASIAYDKFFVYKFFNCGVGDFVEIGNISKESAETALRDSQYNSISPGRTESLEFVFDASISEPFMRVAKITDATFVVKVMTFLRLENVERFEDFVRSVGFDLSDEFQVGNELADLPPNTKREVFDVPVRWKDNKFEIVDIDTCRI